jgi:hypothetical protein
MASSQHRAEAFDFRTSCSLFLELQFPVIRKTLPCYFFREIPPKTRMDTALDDAVVRHFRPVFPIYPVFFPVNPTSGLETGSLVTASSARHKSLICNYFFSQLQSLQTLGTV